MALAGPAIDVPGVTRVLGALMGRFMFGATHPYFASDVMVEADADVA